MALTLLGLLGWHAVASSPLEHRLISDTAFVLAPLAAALTCTAAAVGRREQRRAWAWLAVACAVWCLGAVAWWVDEIVLDHLSPKGSLPALGFVGYSLPAILGLAAFPVMKPRRGSRAWQLLDVTIVWTAIVLIGWVLVLRPGLAPADSLAPATTPAQLLSHLLDSLYPVGDMAVTAVVLVRGMRAEATQRRMWLAFGAGLICISLTDTVYAAQLIRGSFWSGSLLDLGWVLAFLLIGLAPLLPRSPISERRPRALLQDSLPYAPVVVAVVVLALERTSMQPHGLTMWLSLLLLVAVVLRHLLSTRDHLQLAEELEDKVHARTMELQGQTVELEHHTAQLAHQTALLERQAAELQHVAFHDELTGLLSRYRFLALVDSAVAARPVTETVIDGEPHRSYGDPQTLLYLDLDGFTAVNDGFGHAVGDLLLQRVADRLRHATDGRLLARLGGDEFAVLMSGDARQGEALAARLLATLAAPFEVEDRSLLVTGSIGVVSADGPCTGAAELLRCADTALYAAKAAGRARVVAFQPDMHETVVARLELEHDLREALRGLGMPGAQRRPQSPCHSGLFVVYQPVVDLRTGALRGAEALVRWRHPQRGFVSPVEFVPLAEQTGLIDALGRFVLEQAAAELRVWQEQLGRRDLRVSVNVSPMQVSGGLVSDVARVLSRNGLDPASLTLELTESAVAEDSEEFRLAITLVKQLGVRLSVDDFGTGYSSLVRLRTFDFDELKIDRTFVTDLGQGDEALVTTQIALAQGLGLTTVAEGVETEAELQRLSALGCDAVQGYLLGRPMPAEEFRALLGEERLLPVAAGARG